MTIVFELITIISLPALTVIFYLSGETKRGPFDTQAETDRKSTRLNSSH